MKIDVLTLFPESFEPIKQSIIGRATKKNIVKYKQILLVDDIYTTGSTADEVSRILREDGV